MSERIQIASRDGGQFAGYLARPKSGKGPGVIVIQEIFGINANVRAVADRLADEGFVALAPDLFWRQEPGVDLNSQTEEGWKRAMELYQGFDVDKGIEDLIATLDHLRKLDGVNGKVGCQGYCLGGLLAYLMATRSDIDAAIGYYGVGIDGKLDEAKNIRKPLMLHIAQADAFVDATAQKKIHDALDGNPNVTIHDYPGMDHAFTRLNGQHYNKEAADLANGRSLDFLRKHLGA
ncbi:MAG TPA: dienelactone hydrolase family protein [Sphingomonadales bacterium]